MNIVKGVADLIRRSSSGHTGESPGSQGERLSPPTPRIRFRYMMLADFYYHT
ncbi:hypothetical protein Goshw_004372 [Gossypium schwendimanii]|uniref:Uncharacterized protein n=1 Tax=Gossypium schwendimanii TaxID=34291 RepID=A0A7J9MA57_GOSSC|nr:hypothetical protein [Gossypium schwendimanii]